MIVEFIGSTGSGKTTLISKVQRKLAQMTDVMTSFDIVAAPLGLRGVSHPTVQNLIQEFAGFPFLIGSLHKYKAFLVYSYNIFSRNTKFSIHTFNNLRSLERKIGVYEIIKRRNQKQIVLVDEGPILVAHMFAFAGAPVTPSEIAMFAGLLPLPDLIIYIKAPIDTVVKRTMQRPDPPREMDVNDLALTEDYAKRASAIFDQLVETEEIRNRLLIVDNPDLTEEEYEKVVDNVAEFILNNNP